MKAYKTAFILVLILLFTSYSNSSSAGSGQSNELLLPSLSSEDSSKPITSSSEHQQANEEYFHDNYNQYELVGEDILRPIEESKTIDYCHFMYDCNTDLGMYIEMKETTMDDGNIGLKVFLSNHDSITKEIYKLVGEIHTRIRVQWIGDTYIWLDVEADNFVLYDIETEELTYIPFPNAEMFRIAEDDTENFDAKHHFLAHVMDYNEESRTIIYSVFFDSERYFLQYDFESTQGALIYKHTISEIFEDLYPVDPWVLTYHNEEIYFGVEENGKQFDVYHYEQGTSTKLYSVPMYPHEAEGFLFKYVYVRILSESDLIIFNPIINSLEVYQIDTGQLLGVIPFPLVINDINIMNKLDYMNIFKINNQYVMIIDKELYIADLEQEKYWHVDIADGEISDFHEQKQGLEIQIRRPQEDEEYQKEYYLLIECQP